MLSSKPKMSRFIWLGGISWSISSLWSVEGSFYATVIFWSPIFLCILLALLGRKNSGPSLLKITLVPIGIWVATIAIFTLLFIATWGTRPDFKTFFMYSAAYSAGFGSMPILPFGGIWFYALILTSAALGLTLILRRNADGCGPAGGLIAAMGCVLAISTYYIGRAVPNNIVAEYPLLVLSVLITFKATAMSVKATPSQSAIAFPILIVGILSPFWNEGFPPAAANLLVPQEEVTFKLPRASDELISLLASAELTPDKPVIYYGNGAHMPAIVDEKGNLHTFEKSWFPSPLQLLEVPIPPRQRDLIVQRFLDKHRAGGYLV